MNTERSTWHCFCIFQRVCSLVGIVEKKLEVYYFVLLSDRGRVVEILMDLVNTVGSEILTQRELTFIECLACTKYFNKMQSSRNSNL